MADMLFIQCNFWSLSRSNRTFGPYRNALPGTTAYQHLLRWHVFAAMLLTMLLLGIPAESARAAGALQDDADPVTSFWNSVASSAGSQVENVVAGYALSALGLSIPNQENAELQDIVNLLTDIDKELSELVNEVQALECLTAQDQTTLTNSIKDIQGLYDAYANWVNDSPTVPCWEESDDSGNACFGQTGIKTWLDEVTDPENGVDADLDAISDVMIQAGNTGVIYTCVKTITDNYNNSDGPKQYVFDWTGDTNNPGYYDQVQQLTNYYYGIQAQGAALLAEADHLQACLSLGTSQCQFTGQPSSISAQAGLGATPSNPGDICNNAEKGSQAAADCTDAQNSVVKVYDNIKAQLTQAGAPYSNSLVGRAWLGDVVFVKSLEDFTNKATVKGDTLSDCSTPLSSSSPCGFTAGAYNLSFPNNNVIDYAGYSYWTSPSGSDLNTLLTTYNNKTSGDTSGTLGQWMNSVGFTSAENKIVLTPQDGKNWGTTTVCFMDTSIARGNSKQPWCDGHGEGTSALTKQTKSGSCGGACYFADYVAADFTGSSIRSDFYPLSLTWYDDYGNTYDWGTKPGWLTNQQGNTKFHHFHWGAFSISNLPTCTVRTAGSKAVDSLNPGGIYSMCGSDLQDWLDQVLNPPQVAGDTLPITVTSDLQIHAHSTVWESLVGDINVWGHFRYAGKDRNGLMVWQLTSWGLEFGLPRFAERRATLTADLGLEIALATFETESGDVDLWADLFYSGANLNGDMFWTLEDFGFY